MRKYFSLLLLVVLIVPSVAFASWWDLGSWKIFNFLRKRPAAPIVQNLQNEQGMNNESAEMLKNEIEILKQQINDMKSTPIMTPTTAKEKPTVVALPEREKTLSEKVGVSRENLAACVKSTDNTTLQNKIALSVENAMKALPQDQRGTPYAVVIGKNGVKTEIRGAVPYEEAKKLIDEAMSGVVTIPYGGEVAVTEAGDHMMGSANATVKIIEYSDLECPYCQMFHVTAKRLVSESNGNVSWVYRHWPIHQNSFQKLVAAECVAKLKGNDAFWKYVDLLFGLMNPQPTAPVLDQL